MRKVILVFVGLVVFLTPLGSAWGERAIVVFTDPKDAIVYERLRRSCSSTEYRAILLREIKTHYTYQTKKQAVELVVKRLYTSYNKTLSKNGVIWMNNIANAVYDKNWSSDKVYFVCMSGGETLHPGRIKLAKKLKILK